MNLHFSDQLKNLAHKRKQWAPHLADFLELLNDRLLADSTSTTSEEVQRLEKGDTDVRSVVVAAYASMLGLRMKIEGVDGHVGEMQFERVKDRIAKGMFGLRQAIRFIDGADAEAYPMDMYVMWNDGTPRRIWLKGVGNGPSWDLIKAGLLMELRYRREEVEHIEGKIGARYGTSVEYPGIGLRSNKSTDQ